MSAYYKALSIAFDILKGLGVILTLFRLGYRLKIQRFWWEDMWAMVALLCTVVSIIFTVISSPKKAHKLDAIADWINPCMFLSVVWSVRMSLIFSIVRVTPSTLQRRITLAAAIGFFIFWAITISLQTWWCLDHPKRKASFRNGRADCVMSEPIIIFELTTNCIADAATLIFSLKLLWRVRLPRRQRRMVLCQFMASRFLCIFALATNVAQLVSIRNVQELLASLQMGAFLIVCNLLVVVTYIYRVFRTTFEDAFPSESSDSSFDDDFTTPLPPRSTQVLTVVDLDVCPTGTPTASELRSDLCLSNTHSSVT